jgi:hypothetical protein
VPHAASQNYAYKEKGGAERPALPKPTASRPSAKRRAALRVSKGRIENRESRIANRDYLLHPAHELDIDPVIARPHELADRHLVTELAHLNVMRCR